MDIKNYTKVLLIDDSKFIQNILQTEFHNLKFFHSEDSDSAIKCAYENNVDLIIVSGVLKKENGYEIALKIRNIPAIQNTPIIMLSSNKDERFINKAYASGINSFISKENFVDNLQYILSLFEKQGTKTYHTKLLLITDNKNLFYSLKARLNNLGVFIESKFSIDTLVAADDKKFDYIIIDKNIAQYNISEYLKYLKYQYSNNIMVLADKNNQNLIDNFAMNGFKKFYFKPFIIDEFISDLIKIIFIKTNALTDKNILVVDDSEIFRQQITHILQSMNANVITAEEPTIALKILEEKKTDLIITDIYMPNIDGERFIQILKQNERFKDIPIIVISTADRKNKIIACFELGADDFIGKPFVEEEIIARVKRVFEKKI
ncbi:MAG TPA: response regulator [bacterium]|nr:response regulator [bacterium]HPP86608.1 response regulator [bacterium]